MLSPKEILGDIIGSFYVTVLGIRVLIIMVWLGYNVRLERLKPKRSNM